MGLRVATLEEVCRYGGNLPKGLLAPIAGASGPAIDHVFPGGSGVGASTHTGNVPAGRVVIVTAAADGTQLAPALSDSRSNTWTNVASIHRTTANDVLTMWASKITTALIGTTSSGDTISLPAAGSEQLTGAAWTGVKLPAYGAGTAIFGDTHPTTATPTVSTSVPVVAGDVVWAALFLFDWTVTPTLAAPAGWTLVQTGPLPTAVYRMTTTGTGTATFSITPGGTGGALLTIAAVPASPHGLSMLV